MKQFLILLFTPATVLIIYDSIYYWIPLFNTEYNFLTGSYLYFIAFIDILSLIMLLFFFSIKNRIKPFHVCKIHKNIISIKIYILFSIIAFLFLGYLTIHVYGYLSYENIILDQAKFYGLSKRGTAWVFHIINIMILVLVYDLYQNKMSKSKIFFIGLILSLLAATGGRSGIMLNIAFLFYVYAVIHRKRINIILLSMVSIFVLTIFIGNSMSRFGVSFSEYISMKKSKFDSNQAFMFDNTIQFLENTQKNTILVDIITIPTSLIPRKFWPEKPMSTEATRLIYPDIAERGTNITFGIYANILLNLHYFAFLFIPFFLFVYNYLYFKTLNTKNKSFLTFILLYLSIFSVQFYRGGVIDMRIFMMIATIIIAYIFFILLSKKRLHK